MTVPSWAVRGAKVVYVGNSVQCNCPVCISASTPTIGQVCTITETNGECEGGAIRISEVPVAWPNGWWRLDDFRPAVPPRTLAHDIALFQPLLKIRELQE